MQAGSLRYLVISSRTEIARNAVASHYDELDHFYREVWGDHVHHGLWSRGDETREEAVLQLTEIVIRAAWPTEERASARPMQTTQSPEEVPKEQTMGSTEDVQKHVPPRICDIGCGYGAAARVLAARGADVTGITISPAQFAVAKGSAGPTNNLRFVCGDWLQNDFAAESFDAVIAIESSEHMPELSAFFQQAARVLKPGGRLVVCAWLSADQPNRNAIRWLLEPICREGRMPQLATSGEYQSLAAAAGFRSERFEDITCGVKRTWPVIVRLLLVNFFTAPRFLRFLFTPDAQNRIFGLTILRIWVAYRIGAMRYGVFTFVKP